MMIHTRILALKDGRTTHYLTEYKPYRTFEELLEEVLLPAHMYSYEYKTVDIEDLEVEAPIFMSYFYFLFDYVHKKDTWVEAALYAEYFNVLWRIAKKELHYD